MAADAMTPVKATITEVLAGGRCCVRTEEGSLLSAVVAVGLAESGIAIGGRVSVMPSGGAFPGVIVRIEETPSSGAQRSAPFGPRANRISPDRLRIDRTARPDWPTGADRMPAVGEEVYCTEGPCLVVGVLGRTGNGSRLLELRLRGQERRPFFAAASNVLVQPRDD